MSSTLCEIVDLLDLCHWRLSALTTADESLHGRYWQNKKYGWWWRSNWPLPLGFGFWWVETFM